MSNAASRPPLTYAEYVSFERAAPTKHEFVNGEICAMAGGTADDSAIAANIIGALLSALRGSPCRPYTSDLRVRTADDVGAYPDVTVVCGDQQFSDDVHDELLNPAVIFEVLSPSSESYDRGEKFAHYRSIESLREYVMIASERRRVDVCLRREDGVWELRSYTNGGFALSTLPVRFEIDALYEGTSLPPTA
ncbi:MAG: Uma2 family endonuclease [Polyangiales bacterium]